MSLRLRIFVKYKAHTFQAKLIFCTNIKHKSISTPWCKTAVTPLLTHRSYCILAPSHRYVDSSFGIIPISGRMWSKIMMSLSTYSNWVMVDLSHIQGINSPRRLVLHKFVFGFFQVVRNSQKVQHHVQYLPRKKKIPECNRMCLYLEHPQLTHCVMITWKLCCNMDSASLLHSSLCSG